MRRSLLEALTDRATLSQSTWRPESSGKATGERTVRRTAICLSVSAFATVSEFGGTVTFDPPLVAVDSSAPPLSFEVWLETEVGGIDSVDMIIGSDTVPMSPEDWVYSDEATWAFGPHEEPGEQGVYPYGIGGIGGFAFMASLPSPFRLGTLSVEVSSLGYGEYVLQVNGERDEGRSNIGFGAVSDPLSCLATIWVGIPEPGTVGLLACGSLTLLRGRSRHLWRV